VNILPKWVDAHNQVPVLSTESGFDYNTKKIKKPQLAVWVSGNVSVKNAELHQGQLVHKQRTTEIRNRDMVKHIHTPV